MKIIRAYILRELVVPFIMSLLVLTCVFLLGNLIQLTNLVINKGVPLSTIGRVFILYIPVLLGYTLPIACLVAVIITFSRFSADNEILAFRSCGIHLLRLLVPLVVLGLMISLGAVILNERIIPYAHHEQQKTLKNLGAANPTALLEAGMFITSFEGQILFIHKIEDSKMYNVTIYQPQKDGPTRTIIAKRGEFTPVPGGNQIKMKLMEGTSDQPNPQEPGKFYKLNFEVYFMTLDLNGNKKEIVKKPKGMTLKELKDGILDLEKHLVDPRRLVTEYHRKISWSFAPIIFILIGFPIAVITHRREKSANIVLAIFCAGMYYLLSLGCEALSLETHAPPTILMWIPNFVGLVGASILNYRCVL